jgi:hypothetical protein
MRVVGGGNDAAGQIQRLTASKLLPQLTQDEFLLCVGYAATPETQAGSGSRLGGFKRSVIFHRV